jgi:hypothetical protein
VNDSFHLSYLKKEWDESYLKKNGRKSLVLRMEKKKICSLAVSLESNPCRPY